MSHTISYIGGTYVKCIKTYIYAHAINLKSPYEERKFIFKLFPLHPFIATDELHFLFDKFKKTHFSLPCLFISGPLFLP